MESFLHEAHRGSSMLSGYRSVAGDIDKDTKSRLDYNKTVERTASPLFLVCPAASSDRERLIFANTLYSRVKHYKDATLINSSPEWCTFNDPGLHRHVTDRLQTAGVIDRKRFVCNPSPRNGEIVGFRYAGGVTPQHLIFPPGSQRINWLTALRGSVELGKMLTRTKLLPGGFIDPSERTGALELKRLRLWRAIDWMSECARSSGMIRYQPFSVGSGLYDREMLQLDPKSDYEKTLLYQGDHFSRESVLISDLVYTGDIWLIADAIYRNRNEATAAEEETPPFLDWQCSVREREEQFQGKKSRYRSSIEHAILRYEEVSDTRKRRLLDFAKSVLTSEQREALFRAFNRPDEGSSSDFVDACIRNPCRSGVYVMLSSLLKIINFEILNLIGYDAHRILIFKVFLPAFLAVFVTNDGLGDVFSNGSFVLKFLSELSGKDTVASVLERSATHAGPDRHAKNYTRFDPATLDGKLTESSASIPLSINLGVSQKINIQERRMLNFLNEYVIQLTLSKENIAAENRRARRIVNRRRKPGGRHKPDDQQTTASDGESDEEEEEAEDDATVMTTDRDDPPDSDFDEGWSEDDAEGSSRPVSASKTHLQRGRLGAHLLPSGLSDMTIVNANREIHVRDIQKLLSKNQPLRLKTVIETNKYNSRSKQVLNNHAIKAYMLNLLNICEKVFDLKQGSFMNSIHANPMFQEAIETTTCKALVSESVESVEKTEFESREERDKARFVELIMSPPSLVGVTSPVVAERTLQNELMIRSLQSNPIFTSIVNAPHGEVGQYVVLSNLVNFLSVTVASLVECDMPMLVGTVKNMNTVISRGKAKQTKKGGFKKNKDNQGNDALPSENWESNSYTPPMDAFDYYQAGYHPVEATPDRGTLLSISWWKVQSGN